ncbi:M3 family metallopeptidase [Herbaspirillum chlorophenolicum]|uniref:M3 family metallopeptidase n=1 Tax=Herbaspirillum chlorophenolicum TaxID=211589 RepID=A0ABW8F3J4_9BURK
MPALNQNTPFFFLDHPGPLDFALFLAPHTDATIDRLLAHVQTTLAELESTCTEATWTGFIAPLSQIDEHLGQAYCVVLLLEYACDTPAQQKANAHNQTRLLQAWKNLRERPILREKLRRFKLAGNTPLTSEQRGIIDHFLDGILAEPMEPGIQSQLQAIMEETENLYFSLRRMRAQQSDHVPPALMVTDDISFEGLGDDFAQQTRIAAESRGQPGYCIEPHDWPSIMHYAHDRTLREAVFRHELCHPADIPAPLQEGFNALLDLKRQEAHLQGFPDHSTLSLHSNMLCSPSQVTQFLDEVERQLHVDRASQRQQQLTWANELGIAHLEPWDEEYVMQAMRDDRQLPHDESTREWFPASRVFAGLFEMVEQVFGVRLSLLEDKAWHPDVRCVRLEQNGEATGYLYLDLFERPGKLAAGSAFTFELRKGRDGRAGRICPAAAIVASLNPTTGTDSETAWFSHSEIGILFHELGHALHHLLAEQSPISPRAFMRTEPDAMEMPAFFLQRFCWEDEVLQKMSAHADSGEPIPPEITAKLREAAAFERLRLQTSILNSSRGLLALSTTGNETPLPVSPAALDDFLLGLDANFYGYLWSRTLAIDLFAAFRQASAGHGSILNRDLGARYVREILQASGQRSMDRSIEAFHGYASRVATLRDYPD